MAGNSILGALGGLSHAIPNPASNPTPLIAAGTPQAMADQMKKKNQQMQDENGRASTRTSATLFGPAVSGAQTAPSTGTMISSMGSLI